VPGFIRGRRYSVVGSGPQFLVTYEVADLKVFTSPDYLDRLNNPSRWTSQVMPSLLNMNRSLCRVEASRGSGVGRYMQTIRFSPGAHHQAQLLAAVRHEVSRLPSQPLLCGAHLFIADRGVSTAPSRERQLRANSDAVADWILSVEGYDQAAVAEDLSELLRANGARPDIISHLYALDHLVTN